MRSWVKHVRSWRLGRPGVLYACAGGALALIDVALSAFNAISAQQAIALALPAGVAITVGVISAYVTDSWAAWRRGFQQGWEACKLYQLPDVNSRIAAVTGRSGRRGHRGI